MIIKDENLSDGIFILVLYITVKKWYVNKRWLYHPLFFILLHSGSRPSYMILNSPYTCAQFRIVAVHFFIASNLAKYKALRRAVSLGKTLL